MLESDPIYITSATDENMAPGLGIALASIYENTTGPVHAYLVFDRVSEENRTKFRELESRYKHPITIVEADFRDDYSQAKLGGHLSQVTYYRFGMADYMPGISKAIWFDTDVVCMGDLRTLWIEDMKGQPMAGISDPASTEESGDGVEYKMIGLDKDDLYFNAGVIVVDLDQWRTENVKDKMLTHLREVPDFGRFHDQSRLNAFFRNRWTSLSQRFNLQARSFGLQMVPLEPPDKEDFERSLVAPVLVHFNGPCKPWQTRTLNPYKTAYRKFWQASPWRDWRPKEDKVKELRWYYGDLRKNWRRLLWLRKILRRG